MRTLLHSRRVIVPVVIVCAAALALMGARFAAYPAFISAPDQVHIVVTRVMLWPSPRHSTVFDRQFGAVASQVYAQLVSGERVPPGVPSSCPNSTLTAPYYHYELTFSRVGMQTSVATSDARGCQYITLSYLGGEGVYSWYASNGTSFWVRLHELVNAPEPI